MNEETIFKFLAKPVLLFVIALMLPAIAIMFVFDTLFPVLFLVIITSIVGVIYIFAIVWES